MRASASFVWPRRENFVQADQEIVETDVANIYKYLQMLESDCSAT